MKPVHNPIKTRRARAIGYGIDYNTNPRDDALNGDFFYDYKPADTGIIEGETDSSYRIRASNGRVYRYASKTKWEEIL